MAVHCLVPLIMGNDILSGENCAVPRGAWWYQACFTANLNGPHIPTTPIPSLTPWQHDLSWLRFWLTWLKFSWSEANSWKLQKFCPTKISRHTVFNICRTGAHMLLIHEGLALIWQQRTTSKFDKSALQKFWDSATCTLLYLVCLAMVVVYLDKYVISCLLLSFSPWIQYQLSSHVHSCHSPETT